ncbi:unnamed protein product [Arctogadus glacialis]
MDLKAVVFFICLAALCLTSTEAGIPKCCLQTAKKISAHMLSKVQKWEVQQNNGVCFIQALVLYIRGRKKPVCADLGIKRMLKRRLRVGSNHVV